MIFLWLVTAASLVVACAAWRQARRASQRLDQFSQMYWELKYQYGELRQQGLVSGPPAARAGDPPAAPPAASAGSARQSFVPLTSLKRP
jgi:hypothetical protein